MKDLRELRVPWVAAGCPQDGPAPAGALAFVYPPEKKAKATKRSKGNLAAPADLRALLGGVATPEGRPRLRLEG